MVRFLQQRPASDQALLQISHVRGRVDVLGGSQEARDGVVAGRVLLAVAEPQPSEEREPFSGTPTSDA